jgi:cytoskeletal protein CcmA (bactofilin family)
MNNSDDKGKDAPAPEVLKPQADRDDTPSTVPADEGQKLHVRSKRTTYRPSHKATFIGIAVVVAILAVNAVVIWFVVKSNSLASSQPNRSEVTLSPAVLDGLGVSRNPVGAAGTELVVGPNSRFNGKVVMGDNVSIAGQLTLNSKFNAADASLTKLEAGNTSVAQLNVNGDGTISTLNLRKDLSVVGVTRLQGPVTMTQLVTVSNSLNVAGNLAVGGTLSARGFQASSLTSDTTLTIGGHIVTRGNAPNVGPGSALGSNGTVSISGNDASGTIGVNIGVGAGSGTLAQVAFRNQYGRTPHVVVTAVGRGMGSLYVTRTAGGFSVGSNDTLSPGGYAIDYIVME